MAQKITVQFGGEWESSSLAKMTDQLKKVIGQSSASKAMQDSAKKYIQTILDSAHEIDKLKAKGMVDASDVKDLDKMTNIIGKNIQELQEILGKISNAPVDRMKDLNAELKKLNEAAQLKTKEKKSDFKTKAMAAGVKGVSYDNFKPAVAGLKAQADALDQTDPKQLVQYIELDKKIQALNKAHKETASAITRVNTVLKTESQALTDLANNQQKVANQQFAQVFDNVEQEARQAATNVKTFGTAVNGMQGELSKASAQHAAYGQVLQGLQQKIQQVTSVFFILQKGVQIIRQSVATVSLLDKEMTEIGIVSKQTNKELWATFSTFNELARDLSSTTAQYLEGAKIFYQQGYELSEVIKLVDATTKAAALSSVSFADASEAITAALRAYNMEASMAASITDKYAAVGAYSAADFRELSVAMEKVASSAYTAGMSFDSTLGILAKGIETTKEAPEAIGTALKTIIARFQEMKQNPTAILEDGIDANRVEKALDTIGVSLRDASGQFRDLDDVFNDLGGRWKDLSRNQKAYIATMAAGARQQSRFMAIMNNYDRTLELVRMSTNSGGEANRQYAIYEDSVVAANNRMKNSLEALSVSITSSGAIKGFYDGMAGLFNLLTALNPIALVTAVALGGLAFTILKYITIARMAADGTTGFAFAQTLANSTFIQNIASLLGLTTAEEMATLAANKATLAKYAEAVAHGTNTAAMDAEAAAAKATIPPTAALAATMMLVVAAIALVIIAVVAIIAAYNKQKNAVHELAATKAKEASIARENVNNLEAQTKRYSELSKQLTRTNEEQAEMVELSENIVDIAPELVKGIDAEGNAIIDTGYAMEMAIEQYKKYAREAENAASAAHIASMQHAEWNATVAQGAAGEKTSAMADRITESLAQARQNTVGIFGEDWASGPFSDLITAGIEKGMSPEVMRKVVEQGMDLGMGTNSLSSFLATSPEEYQQMREDLDGTITMYENYLKTRLAETKIAVAQDLASTGRNLVDELESKSIEVSDSYKNVVNSLGMTASKLAIVGIDKNDLAKQTEAVLEIAPQKYNEMLVELESLRTKSGFESGLGKIFDEKEIGKSLNELKTMTNNLLENFPVSDALGTSIANSIYNEEALNSAMQTLFEAINTQLTVADLSYSFGNLSEGMYEHFIRMLMNVDNKDTKSTLTNALANVIDTPENAEIINSLFSKINPEDSLQMSAFNNVIATMMNDIEGLGLGVDYYLNILTAETEIAATDIVTYIKEIQGAFKNLNDLDQLLRKVSSGLMELGDVFDYVATHGEESLFTIKRVGENYFISFAEILQQQMTQRASIGLSFEKILTQSNNDIEAATKANDDAANNIKIANSIISGKNTAVIKSKELDYYSKGTGVTVTDPNQLSDIVKSKIAEQQKIIDDLNLDDPEFGSSYDFGERLGAIFDWNGIDAGYKKLGEAHQYLADAAQKEIDRLKTITPENWDAELVNYKNQLRENNMALQETIDKNQELINRQTALKKATEALAEAMKKVSEIDTAKINHQTFMDSVSAINSSINSLKGFGSVFTKLEEGPMTLLDTLQAIGENPDLLMVMDVTEKGIQLSQAGIEKLALAKKGEVSTFIEGEKKKLQLQLAVIDNAITNIGLVGEANFYKDQDALESTGAVGDAINKVDAATLANKKAIYKVTWDIYQLEAAMGNVSNTLTFDTEAYNKGLSSSGASAAQMAEDLASQYNQNKSIAGLTLVREQIAMQIDDLDRLGIEWQKINPLDLLKQASGSSKSASKDFEATLQSMDKYINYLERLEKITNRISGLDTKIDLMATGGSADLKLMEQKANLLADQKYTLQQLVKVKETDLAADRERMKGYGGFASFNEEGLIKVRWDLINSYKPLNEVQQAYMDGMVEEIENYQTATSELQDYQEQIDSTAKAVEDLYQSIIDTASSTRDELYNALIESDQRDIDAKQDKYDKLAEMEDKYLNAIKDAIDEERAARDLSNKEEDLATKKRKLATLERDTSGLFNKQAEDLRATIGTDQQSLRDEAIDKQYELLQNQYSLQQEQRDLEMSSLEEQMTLRQDTRYYWDRVDDAIRNGPADMKSILMNTDEFMTMDPLLQPDAMAKWDSQTEALSKLYNDGTVLTSDAGVVAAIAAAANFLANKISTTNTETFTASPIASSGTSGGNGSSNTGGLNNSSTPISGGDASILTLQKFINYLIDNKALTGIEKLVADGKSGAKTKAAVGVLTSELIRRMPSATYALLAEKGNSTIGSTTLSALKTQFRTDFGIPLGTRYAKGGMVDFTGPAWVDGSKSNPESFLSANDTKLIGSLRDYLRNGALEEMNNASSIDSSIKVGDIIINLANGTNASPEEIARLVQQKFLDTFQNRINTTIQRTR